MRAWLNRRWETPRTPRSDRELAATTMSKTCRRGIFRIEIRRCSRAEITWRSSRSVGNRGPGPSAARSGRINQNPGSLPAARPAHAKRAQLVAERRNKTGRRPIPVGPPRPTDPSMTGGGIPRSRAWARIRAPSESGMMAPFQACHSRRRVDSQRDLPRLRVVPPRCARSSLGVSAEAGPTTPPPSPRRRRQEK